MLLYVVVAICGIVTFAGMPTATKLGKQATTSSPWSHVFLVAGLWATSAGPGSYLYGMSQTTGSSLQKILAIVLGILFALVLLHTLFSVAGGGKKVAAFAFGVIFTGVATWLLGVAFGMPAPPSP
ncbi:MAG: hypothetical protein GTN75_15575 [Gemmatimonadetes bacterium]|nr:hypothetical protein [Gemmatimonadota bacterium]